MRVGQRSWRGVGERQPRIGPASKDASSLPEFPVFSRIGEGLAPAAILQLQRVHGNYFVGNQVLRQSTDVAAETPDLAGEAQEIGNPLVGLTRGDGLTFGTEDRRRRVALLQRKLNERLVAGLGVDGMFGGRTLEALNAFQATIVVPPAETVDLVTADALLGKAPTKPVGPGGQTPAENTVISAELTQAGAQLRIAGGQLGDAAGRLELASILVGGSGRISAAIVQLDFQTAAAQLRTAGSLTRQAGDEMIATAAAPTPLTPTENPLVGLQRGDGLSLDTLDRRERVTLLQEKLNERMLADLKRDGMFGPKTGRALREFQVSIGMPENEVVDPVTADALLFGVLPGVQRVGGGPALAQAGTTQEQAGLSLVRAGANIRIDFDPNDGSIGLSLTQAGTDLGTAARLIAAAGSQLDQAASGPDTIAGGLTLEQAAAPQQTSGLRLVEAGALFSIGGRPTDAATGDQLVLSGELVQVSSAAFQAAGQRVQAAGALMAPVASV